MRDLRTAVRRIQATQRSLHWALLIIALIFGSCAGAGHSSPDSSPDAAPDSKTHSRTPPATNRVTLRIALETNAKVAAISGDGAWICLRDGELALELQPVEGTQTRSVLLESKSEVHAYGPGSRFMVVDGLSVRLLDPKHPSFDAREIDLRTMIGDAQDILGPARHGHWVGIRATNGSLRMVDLESGHIVSLPQVEAVSMDWIAVSLCGERVITASMGPAGAPARLAKVAHVDIWSLREDNQNIDHFGLRSLKYWPAAPNPIANIALLQNGELGFSSWHNLARVDLSAQAVVHHIPQDHSPCFGIWPIGECLVTTHYNFQVKPCLSWSIRKLPELRPIPNAFGLTETDVQVASHAPRFVVRTHGSTTVYELVSG